jgi:hypothetical protein
MENASSFQFAITGDSNQHVMFFACVNTIIDLFTYEHKLPGDPISMEIVLLFQIANAGNSDKYVV